MTDGRSKNRIYIIGAGFTGITIAREIQSKGIFGRVVAFLDDDPGKIGTQINAIPVLGPIEAVVDLLKSTPANEAIIAIPGATREQLKRIYRTLKDAEFSRIRIVPRISQILEGEAHLIQAREIDPQDLLARQPVKVNLRESLAYLRGKRVLITGAGGSIGSELSRQLLSGGAERLYLFGHGENSIYEIERELRLLQEEGVGEKASIVPIIGELQDREYMHFILKRLKAQVVFHAAAHKHVHMLEANPVEAVKNNVFGTLNLVDAAQAAGVQRLVLISTDKAVAPVSVYGATKLLAEEIVLRSARGARSEQIRSNGLVSLVVRFGNVLGSRGSIVPLFQQQILKGGPVTVTHPQVTRFFMTIPEAASLVLQAGGVGQPGVLYLLDMGEPVPIKELAEQMIRFYGYEPEREIEIAYTGLKGGEKLTEKLWCPGEVPEATGYSKILKLKRRQAINGQLDSVLEELGSICFSKASEAGSANEAGSAGNPGPDDLTDRFRNRKALKQLLKRVIPSLKIPEHEPIY